MIVDMIVCFGVFFVVTVAVMMVGHDGGVDRGVASSLEKREW